jgi:ABC-type sugar transport system substrate-binding protein
MAEQPTTKKYIDYLGMSKEDKEAGRVQEKNSRTALSLDSTILDAKGNIAKAESAVADAIQTYPVNWGAVITAKREMALAQDNLQELEALKAELF